MGAFRDAETFALQDASDSGYRQGYRSASTVATNQLADLLGIEASQIEALLGTDLADRLFAIRAAAGAIQVTAEREQSRLEAYTSKFPPVVAWVMFKEETPDYDKDQRGYMSSADYQFDIDEAGAPLVRTGHYTPFSYFDARQLEGGDWVRERLVQLGVEREPEFCQDVSACIAEYVVTRGSVD